MKIQEVEEIALNCETVSGAERRAAFDWADSKRLDKSVSEEYRKRAEIACFTILNWAMAQANVKPNR